MKKQMRSRLMRLLLLLVPIAGLACDPAGEPPSGPFEVIGQPLLGSEQVVSWDGTRHLATTTAYPYVRNGNVGMIAYGDAIQLDGSTDPTVKIYSCTDNFQANSPWNTFWLGLSNQGSDSAGFFRRNFSDPRVYDIHMLKDFTGFRLMWSNDPCGSAAWHWRDYPVAPNGSFDYPQIAYDDARDVMVATWTQVVNGQQRLFATNISHGAIDSTPEISAVMNNCGAIANHNVNLAHIAFDHAGADLHIVYTDFTDRTIRHDIWRPSQKKFLCGNELVGPWTMPAGRCSTCNFATYQGLESSCLRHFPGASIAVDRNTSAIVVAYATPGDSCPDKAETRFLRSTDFGRTFQLMAVTGCQTSVKPKVVAEFAPEFGTDAVNRFHVMTTYAGSSNQFSQVEWFSGDNGATWGGLFITGARSTPDPVNPASCSWGDHDGAASASRKIFYDWEQKDNISPTPVWRVHGITNDIP
jgi:hypothetical protein